MSEEPSCTLCDAGHKPKRPRAKPRSYTVYQSTVRGNPKRPRWLTIARRDGFAVGEWSSKTHRAAVRKGEDYVNGFREVRYYYWGNPPNNRPALSAQRGYARQAYSLKLGTTEIAVSDVRLPHHRGL